jgi:alpha-tubulin suppressor-like RCC1 family protein
LNPEHKIVNIFAGTSYSMILTKKGKLYSYGYNGVGNLGNGNTTN